MAKAVKSLTGAAKDAYLRRAVARTEALDPATAEGVARRLSADVSRVWVRVDALDRGLDTPAEQPQVSQAAAFDPYTPNVIVVVRTVGAAGALKALAAIADIDNLRILAREQQLGIEAELQTLEEIRVAIVAAAERRIVNRRAAAS